MSRCLLTWSDRTVTARATPTILHGAPDRGPVLRLLQHTDVDYRLVRVLTSPAGEAAAQELVATIAATGRAAELRVLPIVDPSDHAQIFAALHGVTEGMPWLGLDVCLSAGTPQMQTLWVILVEAGLLRARMLQVIPAAFVPSVHPHPIREVKLDIEGFPEIRALREEVVRLRAAGTDGTAQMIGDSAPMHALVARLGRLARTDVPVLVEGETGTGKELVARTIHRLGERVAGPFIAENCGAFSEGVLASELFGHERGAFTGAAARRRGLFEQADGGTLFLDEIADTSPRVQVSLLRVLQEGTLRRVGAEEPITVDVRVIAATHRDLPALVAKGEFREDLYYRLCGATVRVPPLRERLGDLEGLVRHFLAELGATKLWPDAAAWRRLRAYPWPGNVRQLRAEVVRWTVFCDREVGVEDLSPELGGGEAPAIEPRGVPRVTTRPMTLAEATGAVERECIAAAIEREGSLAGAARALGIDRNTLKRKLRAHGSTPPRS